MTPSESTTKSPTAKQWDGMQREHCNFVALFALGDASLEQERNQLEGAIQIKLALFRGLERASLDGMPDSIC